MGVRSDNECWCWSKWIFKYQHFNNINQLSLVDTSDQATINIYLPSQDHLQQWGCQIQDCLNLKLGRRDVMWVQWTNLELIGAGILEYKLQIIHSINTNQSNVLWDYKMLKLPALLPLPGLIVKYSLEKYLLRPNKIIQPFSRCLLSSRIIAKTCLNNTPTSSSQTQSINICQLKPFQLSPNL